MRPKLNLKDKSQMSTRNEYTDNVKSNSTCIFLSVRTSVGIFPGFFSHFQVPGLLNFFSPWTTGPRDLPGL